MSEKSHKVEENLQLVNKLSLLIITQKKNLDFITWVRYSELFANLTLVSDMKDWKYCWTLKQLQFKCIMVLQRCTNIQGFLYRVNMTELYCLLFIQMTRGSYSEIIADHVWMS